MKGSDALRAGLLDRVNGCTCAVLEPADRPCPYCRRVALTPKAPEVIVEAVTVFEAPLITEPIAPEHAEHVATSYRIDREGSSPGWREIREEANARAAGDTPAKPKRKRGEPEFAQTAKVVEVLREAPVIFAGSLNGMRASPAQVGKAKAAGMVAGEPDLRIYGHPMRPPPEMLREAAAQLRGMFGGRAHHPVEAVIRWLELGAPSGASLEMKLEDKAKTLRAEDPLAGAEAHQRNRLLVLEAVAGFVPLVGYGAEDALERLAGEGYELRSVLHPAGKCTCHGEGTCKWCSAPCAVCGAPMVEGCPHPRPLPPAPGKRKRGKRYRK